VKKRYLALAGLVGGAAAAGAGAALAGRRWAAAHDPTGGEPLVEPPGAEQRVTTPDGTELAVLVAGPEPADAAGTFVLSHCWTGDRRIWGPVARRLVDRGHRVVLYHQRGHASSTVGRDGLTLAALGEDLRAVLEATDARGAILAGHSMGGMAIQAFATEHHDVLAERVQGMALVATSSGDLRQGKLAEKVASLVLAGTGVNRAFASRRVAPLLVRGTVGRAAALPVLEAVVETFAATPPATRAGFFAAFLEMDYEAALAKVDVPVVVVCGTRDTLTPLSHSRRMVEALPDARLHVIRDAGHMLPCEAPDEVAGVLDDHLRSTDRRP
jgi:pimeloyl-ACP methyl ester carboxylesterase